MSDHPKEYKPITIEDIQAVADHLRKIMSPPIPEPIYLTQEEWDSLCKHEPIQLNGQTFQMHGHKVYIVTAEERETLLKLKQQCYEEEQRQTRPER